MTKYKNNTAKIRIALALSLAILTLGTYALFQIQTNVLEITKTITIPSLLLVTAGTLAVFLRAKTPVIISRTLLTLAALAITFGFLALVGWLQDVQGMKCYFFSPISCIESQTLLLQIFVHIPIFFVPLTLWLDALIAIGLYRIRQENKNKDPIYAQTKNRQ